MSISSATTVPPSLFHPVPKRASTAALKTLLREYGIAVLALVTAVALRLALSPWLGAGVPFITLFPAVAVTVWYGGYRPALLVAILAYVAIDQLLVEPATSITGSSGRLVAFSAYFVSCAIIIAFGEGMRRSKRRLQSSELALQRQVEALARLHGLALRLTMPEDLEAALSAILKILVEIHRGTQGLVSLYDTDMNCLIEAASVGFTDQGRATFGWIKSGADGGPYGRAFATGRRALVFDAETDPSFAQYRAAARALGLRAVHSTPIQTRSGDILGVISVHFSTPRDPDGLEIQIADLCARDAAEVIESRRNTQALHESEQRLRRQLAELEQQLIASGHLVSMGEITASLAHEFNNPLGILMGFAQDLRSEKQPDHPDYKPLTIIYEEARRCQKIVAELLEFSRPQVLHLKEIRAGESIEKALSFVRARLYGQNIQLSVAVDSDVPFLIADPVLIEQVLVNLFLNAIDAMPNGGSLAVHAARASIDGREFVCISVSDTGAGIAAESLPRIFQPFFTEKKRTGLGLGLPLSKRIIQNHGGMITVESVVDHGTTFTIRLPLRRAEQLT